MTDFYEKYLQDIWYPSSEGIQYSLECEKMLIENKGSTVENIRCAYAYNHKQSYVEVVFEQTTLNGSAAHFTFADENNNTMGDTTTGSRSFYELPDREVIFLVISVPAYSQVRVKRLGTALSFDEGYKTWLDGYGVSNNRVCFVVPTYPSQENSYLSAFVHARVLAYQAAGIGCDVLCAREAKNYCMYEYEGVRALRLPINDLGKYLHEHNYDVVISHFFDMKFAQAFDEGIKKSTWLIIKSHGGDTLYWDMSLYSANYFKEPQQLTKTQIDDFSQRDKVFARYNAEKRVLWSFVTEAVRERSAELTGVDFKKYLIIPEIIDEKLFVYAPKNPALRKKIFFCKKFDNLSSYAIDINIAVILELSKRPYFDDLEFNIYGRGNYYAELVEPLRKFSNVRLNNRFIRREDLPSIHAENGIGLFATRLDAQGVSMSEAAMSGLAVVSSQIEAAQTFLPGEMGLLAQTEEVQEYVTIIEKLYFDPDFFTACSRACHEKIYKLGRRDVTVNKEIKIIKKLLRRSFLSPSNWLCKIRD